MPRRNDTARLPAAACALLLAGCAAVPALTLTGSSSWRSRRDGTGQAHAWSAGARLGWSAAAGDEPDPGARLEHEREPDERGAVPFASSDGAPCAFEATCHWERAERSAAYGRAREPFAEDGP
jgi:hypothetical protein